VEPKNLHFGGGVAETIMNPAVFAVVLVVGLLILLRPRKSIIAPFLAACLLIPIDQVLVLGGMHFPMMRVLALFGIVRMIRDKSRKEQVFSGGINRLDRAMIALTIVIATANVLLFREMGAVVFQFGNVYTAFGLYFFVRYLVRGEEDVLRVIRAMQLITIIIAIIMAYEFSTGHNPYALLGGADADRYASLVERDNKFRAMGPFGISITAGCFAAMMLPASVLLWIKSNVTRDKILAVGAALATVVMAVTSNSSTPVMAYAGGILAFCLWPVRNSMRLIRWAMVVTVVGLHLVMKAPVWHLISRIDISGGSSSYHRFALIDQCIRHFGDWWLIGVKSTAEWGWDMWDTANAYVGTADNSGLVALILFVAVIVYAFKFLGRARKATKNRKQQFFFWTLGAALFTNVISYVGISYWDQTIVAWYALLACICAVAAPSVVRKAVRVHDAEPASMVETPALLPQPEPVSTSAERLLHNSF
jgi:hypothetical protein